MDVPEPNPWTAPPAPVAADSEVTGSPEGEERPRRPGVVWRSALTGHRFVSYVAGPVAGLVALAAAVPMAIGLGAGRGLGFHPALLTAIGVYLAFTFVGMIVGGAVGQVLKLIPSAGLRWAADRPVRLRFWKRQEAPRLARRRRWPWVLGGLAWFVILTALGVGVYLGRIVDVRLNAAVAAADRDDPNWRINDLITHRDPVPDQENSARRVGDVVALLPANWPSPATPAVSQPSPRTTEVQPAFERAAETPDNVSLDAATADVLRQRRDEYEEAVRLARTVAEYARGRHELVLGPTIVDTPLPETQQARMVAQLLTTDAALLAEEGDPDRALDACRALIGVGRSIGDEPFLISQLVRQAIGGQGLRSARRVLGQGEPSDAALARLQALLLAEMNAPLMLYGMRGERATVTEIIRRAGSGELQDTSLADNAAPRADGRSQGTVAPWVRLQFDYQRAVALEWMNQAVAITRCPAAEQPARWKAWEDELELVRQDRICTYLLKLPLMIVPALAAAPLTHARFQAELRATALLLAAERHRQKTGAWPASADSIAAEILTDKPVDPYSGRPFVFDYRDGRLIVHSVGPNLKHEQGALKWRRWLNSDSVEDDVGATAWDVALRRQSPP